MNNKGFTIIELIITITIIATLSAIVLFNISKYINKGKDSNIYGNLVTLIPAGEVYYNIENAANSDGYNGFCNPLSNSALKNVISQIPINSLGACYSSSITNTTNPAGVCCYIAADNNSWAACAREFTNTANYYCVDSRGMKEEVVSSSCSLANLTSGTSRQCP
jgi:prepilin-type N-terminal cleavage/methylation domain-containing protein